MSVEQYSVVGGTLTQLLRFWWKHNYRQITEQSISDCHAKGLHSIMFVNQPGCRLRMFVTDKQHELDRLSSVAFHSHRFDIKLNVVYGSVINILPHIVQKPGGYAKYEYRSCILDGSNGGFERISAKNSYSLEHTSMHNMKPGDAIEMPWDQYHTVMCPPKKINAWIVQEAIEQSNYVPHVFSDENIERLDLSNLYNPISASKIEHLLTTVNILQ